MLNSCALILPCSIYTDAFSFAILYCTIDQYYCLKQMADDKDYGSHNVLIVYFIHGDHDCHRFLCRLDSCRCIYSIVQYVRIIWMTLTLCNSIYIIMMLNLLSNDSVLCRIYHSHRFIHIQFLPLHTAFSLHLITC